MKFQLESIRSRTNVYEADIKSASLDLSGAAVFLQQSPVRTEIFCLLLQEFEKSCPLPPRRLLTHTRVVASGEASGARPTPLSKYVSSISCLAPGFCVHPILYLKNVAHPVVLAALLRNPGNGLDPHHPPSRTFLSQTRTCQKIHIG